MRVFSQTIGAIVDENYVFARALSYLGIEFYNHPDRRLGELCEEMKLDRDYVLRCFYLFDQNKRVPFSELKELPLPIIIEYLKHTHRVFVKEKLPYIAGLVSHWSGNEDLKIIFPVFVEEFISHIHEEEDAVFEYIYRLIRADQGQIKNPYLAFWKYKDTSLQDIHDKHLEEDELAGLRGLVEAHHATDLQWKVIANEIKSFDREMMYHAEIENKILFPKAIQLEAQVKGKIESLSRLN